MKYSYAERIWYQVSFLILAGIPVILVANYLDTRLLNDIPIWIKPLKFHISIALHLLTFAVLIRFLPDKTRHSVWLTVLAFVSSAATIIEMLIIDFQAARGVHSHFNFSSQFDGMLYAVMGIAALLLSLPALVLGIRFIFAPVNQNQLTPGLKLGIVLGLISGFVLTLTIAGYMSMQSGGHWVAAPKTDAGGLPVVGWTRQGGDLRVPHFFATHLMQILPLAGYLLDRLFHGESQQSHSQQREFQQSHSQQRAVRQIYLGVSTVAILGIALTIGTLLQALAGEPFIA